MSGDDRPGLDEYDTGSYLDGGIAEHDVLSEPVDGSLVIDPAPSFRSAASRVEAMNMWNGGDDYCLRCAFNAAQDFGYQGPRNVAVRWGQYGHLETEQVLVLIEDDRIVSVASYSYGRAYFEPGEPRTAPCGVCGVETLKDTLGPPPSDSNTEETQT